MAKSSLVAASPPRHRLQRRPCQSHPSTIVFAVLSSIVASASADGRPLACQSDPLYFLCPSSVDYQEVHDPYLPGPSSSPQPILTPTSRKQDRRAVPDSYSQGDDGRWRKISKWSFYGSTMCLCDNDTTTSANHSGGDIIDTSSTSPDIRDSLPTGWSIDTSPNRARTGLILSVSLVLACIITTFIVGCIYWRRKRKRRAEKDPEKKHVKKVVGGDEDTDTIARTKSKLWAKASARWKDNIKQSARRRRNARLTSASLSQLNGSSICSSRLTTPVPSARSSLALSRSSTVAPSSVTVHIPPDADTTPPSASYPLDNPVSFSLPSSPPAYQGNAVGSSSSQAMKVTPLGEVLHEPLSSQSFSSSVNDCPPTREEGDPQYVATLHSAHVATDDKAVLQRMVVMGSEPPVEGGSHYIQGSAPDLYDDDQEDFGHHPKSHSHDDVGSSVMFPAPPEPQPSSKGKMAALEYYDHEDLDVEPSSEPSAPPFEMPCGSGPSAPPFDIDAEFMVSSTPVMDECDAFGGASAPPAEDEVGRVGSQARTSFQAESQGEERPQPESLPRYQP